jgi:hypothetical protein
MAGANVPAILITTSSAGPLAGGRLSVTLPGTSLRQVRENIGMAHAHMLALKSSRGP